MGCRWKKRAGFMRTAGTSCRGNRAGAIKSKRFAIVLILHTHVYQALAGDLVLGRFERTGAKYKTPDLSVLAMLAFTVLRTGMLGLI